MGFERVDVNVIQVTLKLSQFALGQHVKDELIVA